MPIRPVAPVKSWLLPLGLQDFRTAQTLKMHSHPRFPAFAQSWDRAAIQGWSNWKLQSWDCGSARGRLRNPVIVELQSQSQLFQSQNNMHAVPKHIRISHVSSTGGGTLMCACVSGMYGGSSWRFCSIVAMLTKLAHRYMPHTALASSEDIKRTASGRK